MSLPPKPPEGSCTSPSASVGFWSQERLHMRPHQRQYPESPPPSLLEHPQHVEQRPQYLHPQHQRDTPAPQQKPWHAGMFGDRSFRLKQTNVSQQQHDITLPAPAQVQPQPHAESFVRPERSHTVSRTEEKTETTASASPTQKYGAFHPQSLRALGGQIGQIDSPSPKNDPETSPATWESDHYQAQPSGEPYLPPVPSIEADQASRVGISSITPGPSTSSEQLSNCGNELYAQPKLRAPLEPGIDLGDDSIPLDVRYAAWKKFQSKTADAQQQWVEDGCPPCTARKCHKRSHPPPHRSSKNIERHKRTVSIARWLVQVCNGALPCLHCGRIHGRTCRAPFCEYCGAYHLEKFSCDLARDRINEAKALHQQHEERQQKKLQDKQQKFQNRQQQTQQPSPPTPGTPPPPLEEPLGSMEFEFLRKMVEKKQWGADEWGKFAATREAAGQTKMKSGFIEMMMDTDDWGAEEWATFMASYDNAIRSHGKL